jgi:uncharacterized protein (TIGR03034 family)
LIDHFRYGNGSGFYTQRLNSAFHDRINGYFIGNPLLIIKDSIQTELSLNNRKTSVPEFLGNIKRKLLKSTLPKYNKKMDRVNGLGISVHDIAAQKITLLNFQQYAIGWSATVHFLAQDHFGLMSPILKVSFTVNSDFSGYGFSCSDTGISHLSHFY